MGGNKKKVLKSITLLSHIFWITYQITHLMDTFDNEKMKWKSKMIQVNGLCNN